MAGSKPGERRGGRQKGTPNRITYDQRLLIKALLDRRIPDIEKMIDDTWHGIEIEKQMPNGETVVGRLNADPKGAAEIIIKLAEFSIPKLGRMEHTGMEGGALEIIIKKEPASG